MRYQCFSTLAILVATTIASGSVYAQTVAPTAQATPAPQSLNTPPAGSYERVSGRNNPAINFFGGGKSMSYAPRPYATSPTLPPQNSTQRMRVGKPFSGVQQSSGVSPYLGLDARESESSIPNYYQFVKPAIDQQRTNQVQQAQYIRLQRQFRTTAASVGATLPNGTMPTTGHSSQFMNNGGFYPQPR